MPDPAHLLAIAVSAARDAGGLLVERFGGPPSGLDEKSSRTDPVSDADRDAEELIVSRLRAARPDDGLVGEEGTADAGTSGVRWVIDPLDGTVNYLWGIPQWAVSIAALDARGALVGVVHDPLRGETFHAMRGRGAWVGEVALRVDRGAELADALVGTGFGYDSVRRAIQARRLVGVIPHVRDIRRAGSAALDLCWVACGRLDGYYEYGVQHWDWAAGALVAAEAGVVVVELAAGPEGAPGLMASRPGIADSLRAVVEAAAPG